MVIQKQLFFGSGEKYKYVEGISTLAFENAAFDNSMTSNKAIYRQSRFIKVPYKNVRKTIEAGIKKLLEEEQQEIIKLEKETKKWLKQVQKMPYDKRAALRIEFKNNFFTVKALNPERINFEGFGSALRKIKADEVSVSPEAMKVLEQLPQIDGLTGLDIDSAGGITYGSQSFVTTHIPKEDVSVSQKHLNQLKKLIIIE